MSSTLVDFALTTWDVAPDALASRLPPGLVPDTFELDDGRRRAFVSAVTFLNVDFFVRFAPWVKLRAHQTNYRAYVRRGGTRCVWFFGTSLASVGVFVPRVLWGLPWAHMKTTHQADWDEQGLGNYRWSAQGGHGVQRLGLRGTGRPMPRLDGFVDAATAHEVLTQPMVGYLRRRERTVVTYSVFHEPFAMEVAEVDDARFELFERVGVVQPGQAPHSALVQRQIHYDIALPPRRVRPPLATPAA